MLQMPMCKDTVELNLLEIKGALLICEPRFNTEYYGFECNGSACQIVDMAITSGGILMYGWSK